MRGTVSDACQQVTRSRKRLSDPFGTDHPLLSGLGGRARCATALLLGGAMVVTPGAAIADHACGPTVVVSGPAAIVADVRRELALRKIDTPEATTCPAVRAQLTSGEEGHLVVDVDDAAGRHSRRTVARVSEAVSLIESWARPELTTDLMTGFTIEPLSQPPAPPPSPKAPQVDAAVRGRTATRVRDSLTIAIVADVALDTSAAAWAGGTATACARVRRWCVGGTGQLRTAAATGRQAEATVLATIEMPIAIGRVVLAPGLGVGLGFASWNITEGAGMTEQGSRTGLRGEGRVTVSYPLGRRVFVDGLFAADISPFTGEPQNQGSGAVTEPVGFFRFGAGLRIGAP